MVLLNWCSSPRWRYLFDSLTPELQLDLLDRLIIYRRPTIGDWRNLFREVKYEFKTSWHYRLVLILALAMSIVAIVEILQIIFLQPLNWSNGLLGFPILVIIIFWIFLWRGIEEKLEPTTFTRFGLFGVFTFWRELLRLFGENIVWNGMKSLMNSLSYTWTVPVALVVGLVGAIAWAGAGSVAGFVAVVLTVAGSVALTSADDVTWAVAMAVAGTVTVPVAVVLTVAGTLAGTVVVALTVSWAVSWADDVAMVGAGFVAVVGAGFVALTVAVVGARTRSVAVALTVSWAVPMAMAVVLTVAVSTPVVLALTVSVAGIGAWVRARYKQDFGKYLTVFAFPFFCWSPIVFCFSTLAFLQFLSWQCTLFVWLTLIGVGTGLWLWGQKLEEQARNPLKGILDRTKMLN